MPFPIRILDYKSALSKESCGSSLWRRNGASRALRGYAVVNSLEEQHELSKLPIIVLSVVPVTVSDGEYLIGLHFWRKRDSASLPVADEQQAIKPFPRNRPATR